ncbi:MAG: ATP-binding protein [Alphaproteobacteria bacterium]|nr:ATP-binding protein [Alphaproteobacteria bacterium]
MLIGFQVENFRSFKSEQTFSMVAGHFSEHVDTNTFDPPIAGFGKLLRTAAVYGPNAGGKTNLLLALKFIKDFVVNSASATAAVYPYSPFKLTATARRKPSKFQITFVQDRARYDYGFWMGSERIEKEWLVEYAHSGSRTRGRTLFERDWNAKGSGYTWKFSSFLKGQRSVWSEATRPDALFLSTAIQLNSTQLRPVFDWFQQRLIIIVGDVKLNESLTINLLEEPHGKERLLPFLREADLGIADLQMKKEPIPPTGGVLVSQSRPVMVHSPGGASANLITVTLSHQGDGDKPVGFDFSEESTGTQILFKTAGAWLNVLKNGEVLVFDEIDTNMHPALLRYLLSQFQSKKTNPNNAQLICSTHNTSILDRALFRRDQVWFTEKDQSGASHLYPLSDFSPRTDESFEKAYMRGRYGAQPVFSTRSE